MSFKVAVGPPQIAIHQAMTVLVTETDGQIVWPSDKGLYLRDTRLISAWSVEANGVGWESLNGGAVHHCAARIYLTNRGFLTEAGSVPARTLAFALSRQIDGGLHEDLDITNHGRVSVRFNLEVMVRSDFSDVFDVKSNRNVRRGNICSAWSDDQTLTTTYQNKDFIRAVKIAVETNESRAVYANGRLSFEVEIAPGQSWHACLLYTFTAGHEVFPPPPGHASDYTPDRTWRDSLPKLHTGNEEFYRMFQQAIEDMGSLRLPVRGTLGEVFVPAAGLPWFMAPFGRDSLIASLQTLLISSDFARGALDVLGHWQAKTRDPWRDAEPGKIMHELRYGELAHFHLIRHTPYYGTADATPLCPGSRCTPRGGRPAIAACWKPTCRTPRPHCAGSTKKATATATCSRSFISRHPKTAMKTWTGRSSGDSMTSAGRRAKVQGPKALCELQGYVYDAWQRMAEVFEALGRPERAAGLRGASASPPCSTNSTTFSGTRKRDFTSTCSTARSGRCTDDRLQRRTFVVVWHRAAGSRGTRRRPPDGARHEHRPRHPHAVQPARRL